jgi:P27 family predicted phage terminase small subunit
MSNGGRPRTPKKRKIIQGTFRKDRNPEQEPEPPALHEAPKPPSHLGRYGKRLWKSFSRELADQGLLTLLDTVALELVCEQYDQYRQAHDAVYKVRYQDFETGKMRTRRRKLGEYLAGRNSQTIPEYNAMNKHFDSLRKLLTEFGMTPASRNKIDLKTEQGEDPMESLLDAE